MACVTAAAGSGGVRSTSAAVADVPPVLPSSGTPASHRTTTVPPSGPSAMSNGNSAGE